MALKGFGYGCKTPEQVAQLEKLNLDWFYTWGDSPNLATDHKGFVPMLYSNNADRVARLPESLAALSPKATHLLGVNEPDHSAQAEMTTREARALWPHMQKTGLILGSPATTHPRAAWFHQFLLEAKTLHSPDLDIDFLAVHIYQSPVVKNFTDKIDELWERYGKPVWVTETCVADWDADENTPNRYGRTQVNEYMAELWDEVQKRPWLQRFAWKTRAALDPQMGTGALFHTDGRLTTTGTLYASL